jgi:hypothetical protein
MGACCLLPSSMAVSHQSDVVLARTRGRRAFRELDCHSPMTGRAQAIGATATYRVLRELGRRSQRSYAAAHDDGSIVVLHRFTRDPKSDGELVSAAEMAILMRDARCLERNWHPNIARVRHVDLYI